MAGHLLTMLIRVGESVINQSDIGGVKCCMGDVTTSSPSSSLSTIDFTIGIGTINDVSTGPIGVTTGGGGGGNGGITSTSLNLSINRTIATVETASVADWLVLFTLETLGVVGLLGNLTLLAVIVCSGLLERPSFILIASLAMADVLHAVVTSFYFYPPVVLKYNGFDRLSVRLMNAMDWTAWGITLTHMTAICMDRLMAIVLYQSYSRVITCRRAVAVSVCCWLGFAGVNASFAGMDACCIVVPQPEFYTFGFEESTSRSANVYKQLYVPLECISMLVLAIGNPIILFNIYRKYRRKRTLRATSVVLVEVGQSLCRQHLTMDVSLMRDVKIFVQIVIVTVIFFAYMFIYYLFFYLVDLSNKWSTMFNSFSYSITHMINPVVYFSLNEQMKKQLADLFVRCGLLKQRQDRRKAFCASIIQAVSMAATAVSEMSPLIKSSSMDNCEQKTDTISVKLCQLGDEDEDEDDDDQKLTEIDNPSWELPYFDDPDAQTL